MYDKPADTGNDKPVQGMINLQILGHVEILPSKLKGEMSWWKGPSWLAGPKSRWPVKDKLQQQLRRQLFSLQELSMFPVWKVL